MTPSRSVPLLIVAAVLGACGGSDDVADDAPSIPTIEPGASTTVPLPTTARPTSTTPPSTSPPTSTTTPSETTMSIPIGNTIVEQAVADLAARLDIDPATIEVVSVEDVTWRDGSLGCPEPGRVYTQALVDGQRIVLAVDGVQYAYHVGRSGDPFYCPAAQAVDPVPDPKI